MRNKVKLSLLVLMDVILITLRSRANMKQKYQLC